jgi:N-methylhydantoinase A/oxoprolinase/acetone carboxylase beta subunit
VAPLNEDPNTTEEADARLLLGVDTGGTYTDAVILDAATHRVLASAKALTTRDDLAIGVSNALDAISTSLDPERVALVSISTTLATNAVVEGHGSPILVFLVGFDEKMLDRTGISSAFADAVIVLIDGGHNHYGYEEAPLDTDAIRSALVQYGRSVRAVAVASTFAVRNAEHEHAVRDLVMAETDLAVTVSSSLSESLDAPRRALTTALNARLLSRISDLVDAVGRSLDMIGINAPVMVAKGDGSLAAAESVARRPIETVLSGPAASIVGAAALTGLDDFILSDIGGTTTDVGQLRAGRPRLVADGARVGGWRTMVEAIDVRTTGLGGDSEVHTDRADVTVGPQRRVPLSLLAVQFPEIVGSLGADVNEPPSRDVAAAFVVRVSAHPPSGLGAIEQRVFDRLKARPTPLREVAPGSVERRALGVVVDKGLAHIAGFTPSDAAHVLGLQANWSSEGALAGAGLMAWYTGQSVEDFCTSVWSETVRRSTGCVLDVAFDDEFGDALTSPVVDAVASGVGRLGGVAVSFAPAVPIVAVGGPAEVYYPEVAKRCGAELVLPEQFWVANAVGAAAGHVVVRTHAEVHSDGPGVFRVVSGTGSEPVSNATQALEMATARARDAATTMLDDRCAGLTERGDASEFLAIERHDAPDARGDEGLYSAIVQLELRARPCFPRR